MIHDDILLQDSFRNDIIDSIWNNASRVEIINNDKYKYLKGPYKFKDLQQSILKDKIETTQFLLDKIIFNDYIELSCINLSKSFEMFLLIYNFFSKIEEFYIDNNINVNKYVNFGDIRILKFIVEDLQIYNKVNFNSILYNDIEKYNYLTKSVPNFNPPLSCLFENIIIYLIKEKKIEYKLIDAIYNFNMSMIDYFLEKDENIDEKDAFELFELDRYTFIILERYNYIKYINKEKILKIIYQDINDDIWKWCILDNCNKLSEYISKDDVEFFLTKNKIKKYYKDIFHGLFNINI
jgi:hypothetical protein